MSLTKGKYVVHYSYSITFLLIIPNPFSIYEENVAKELNN